MGSRIPGRGVRKELEQISRNVQGERDDGQQHPCLPQVRKAAQSAGSTVPRPVLMIELSILLFALFIFVSVSIYLPCSSALCKSENNWRQ
jgi:hypothetical protein